MAETKLSIRFFTIADFEEEEVWLRNEHRKGWKIKKMLPPCFYTLEKCEPEDVIYRLAYKTAQATSDYRQLFLDYGWEYTGECFGWLYFRQPASQVDTEKESELFSDNESKIQMLQDVIKTRFLPVLLIFIVCIIPQILRQFNSKADFVLLFGLLLLFFVYSFLLVYCGWKLKNLMNKYKG